MITEEELNVRLDGLQFGDEMQFYNTVSEEFYTGALGPYVKIIRTDADTFEVRRLDEKLGSVESVRRLIRSNVFNDLANGFSAIPHLRFDDQPKQS